MWNLHEILYITIFAFFSYVKFLAQMDATRSILPDFSRMLAVKLTIMPKLHTA